MFSDQAREISNYVLRDSKERCFKAADTGGTIDASRNVTADAEPAMGV